MTSSPTLSYAARATERPHPARMGIVVTGHVDHGKSTVVGRLLADTGSLPEGRLEQIRDFCARTARPFEYAFLLDALKDERTQGITIDAARIFFRSGRREYVILDAPGHIEFLKNMITGASRAEAALLVIDVREGIQENSRRHGYMLSLLGVRQISVLVNKMDLVGYDQTAFDTVTREFGAFLRQIDIQPASFIPVSGRAGANIAAPSPLTSWYDGPTVVQALDDFRPDLSAAERPFRMPVQDVYKFSSGDDDRRIIAGSVLTGNLSTGDEVVFLPSGKRGRVRSIESFNAASAHTRRSGEAAGFTLQEQIYVSRGELAVRADEPKPSVTTRLRVSLFWLGRQPLVPRKDYLLKLGTTRVPVRLEVVERVLDAATLEARSDTGRIERNDVADCVLKLGRAIAFDIVSAVPETGRFVLVDDFEIRGGGIIREALTDKQTGVRERVLLRNYNWEPSGVPADRRAERYGQLPRLILITGERDSERKSLARKLEQRLFIEGRLVYFLGIGNVLYGVDADIGRAHENRAEHMRRMAEIANLFLDAGAILIVTAAELTPDDLEIIRAGVDPALVTTVWIGDAIATGLASDLRFSGDTPQIEMVERIKSHLSDAGVVFRVL